MDHLRPLWPFQRLQLRFVLTYMIVTLSATVVLEAIGLALIAYQFRPGAAPDWLAHELSGRSASLARILDAPPPDAAALHRWLTQVVQGSSGPGPGPFSDSASTPSIFVVDARGVVLASYPQQMARPGTRLLSCLSGVEAGLFKAGMSGRVVSAGMDTVGRARTSVMISPVFDENGRLLGLVFARQARRAMPPPGSRDLGPELAHYAPWAAAVGALMAALIGVFSGFMTSRRFISRLDRIAGAADAWSRGEFTASAPDGYQDEMGQLAGRLNQMASQLQQHFSLQQQVATMEERNRLARDLHDTVKQQVFAASMQVGAARALLGRDPVAAEERLAEAEGLVHQVQQELTNILDELRPASTGWKGLAGALRELASHWTKQSRIPLDLDIADELSLGADVEQELYRIAQEALANIARHSRATRAVVQCRADQQRVVLTISDNGRGMDRQEMPPGMGIRNMRERADLLPGGHFALSSQSGHGMIVEVSCNLQTQGSPTFPPIGLETK